MADVEQQFEAAVNVIRSMPKKGTYQPSYETMLKFYGYYKQAKEGPCNESEPGFWNVVKKAKWDAWSSLGNISKVQAMESYIDELKKVMETMPDTEEMADFSAILKSFYDIVYAPTGEEPPHILRIFKKLEPEGFKVEKCNGYTVEKIATDQQDGDKREDIPQEDLQSSDIHLNGPHSNGHNNTENGLLHHENDDLVIIDSTEKSSFLNGSSITQQDTPYSHDLKVEHSTASNLYIVEVGSQKKGLPDEVRFSDVPNNQDIASRLIPDYNGVEDSYHMGSESDDSDEEFCDSIDPEHLSIIKTESSELNDAPDGSQTHFHTEPTNGSCDHDQSDCESNDDGNEVSNHQRLTSTPFHKKPVHVTFNTEEKKSSINKEGSGINHHNGGILKVKQAGSGYGGGDAKQSSSRQRMYDRFSQSRQQASRAQDDRGITSSEMRQASGTTGHSDSDSDDTNHNCESCDSSGERDESNERIIAALERIQQDMNRVLRRLETMEDVMALRQEQHSVGRFQRREQEPWWHQFLPSKTVAFLVLWPFVINLIFYYIRKRKARKC